jgi:thiol-disulfide isomerase/thioredoxin
LGTKGIGRDSITVYFFLLDECRICQELAPEINAIHQEYAPKKVGFIGLFPNFASKPSGIEKFKKKYKLIMQTKTDYYKKWSHKFKAEILPTAVVYNEFGTIINSPINEHLKVWGINSFKMCVIK